MAGNSVAASLVMLVFLIGGLFMGLNIKQEVFPEFSLDRITISVAYPGASPEEVENAIVTAIEEALQGLEDIDEINAAAEEGLAFVNVTAIEGADINRLWQDIRNRVGRITTFPAEAEEPRISIADHKREVLRLALYGNISETDLRTLADRVSDTLAMDTDISLVELSGIRDREIHVEISESILRRYNISLEDVARAISHGSVELGTGRIRAVGGDILLRVKNRREFADQFAKLPVITLADGSSLTLGDIAIVREGFDDDSDNAVRFNGQRAVIIEVYRVGNQSPVQVARAGRRAAARINATLPLGVHLTIVKNRSKVFAQRADLLLRNAYFGLGLVFFFLALFLDIRLAFWVSLGIPVSFLGSFLFLGWTDFSINVVSMFAFIVTLGIVVDDAVVVGENIWFYRRSGLSFMDAAVKGAREIAMPVVFSVITNMAAFIPLFFVPGIMGKIFHSLPVVVVAVFGVSLIESLFILPAHLGHTGEKPLLFPLNHLEKWQRKFSIRFENAVHSVYGSMLAFLLEYRYAVIAAGTALLMATAGYVASGRMGMVLFPKVESDFAFCEAVMPFGTAGKNLEQTEQILVAAARKVVDENGGDSLSTGIFSSIDGNHVQVMIYLTAPDIRPLSTSEVIRLWRAETPPVPGLENISFESDRGGPGHGKGLAISLIHRNRDMLARAGRDLGRSIGQYSGVNDIDDGSARGKRQFDLTLTSAGRQAGLTPRSAADQIRHAFQGIQALKIQRGRNEVTIRVRLPENERKSESGFDNLVLRAPEGWILLKDAVRIEPGRAYTTIRRVNGRREIQVTANVRPASAAKNILSDIKKHILPELQARYPGLSCEFRGRQADIRQSVSSLLKGFGLALFCIFALLAVPFRSWLQPLIIMFCIPFGIIGAIAGHVIMGYSLSVMSLFGVVAMSGVVVNDSLVLIDYTNRQCRNGVSPAMAVLDAGIHRFRPILLTTITTCGGLAPIIFETSRQARFLIPMAISLGFGIMFATFITLVMVPCLYLILEDIKNLFK